MADPYKRDRRIGQWTLPHRYALRHPDVQKAIQLSDVTILAMHHNAILDVDVWAGFSPFFEIVEPGREAPYYAPRFRHKGAAVIGVEEWVKLPPGKLWEQSNG